MALKSQWFGSNERCRQCAAVDAKHIKAGDSGLHVFLVQEALILIDGARIDQHEVNKWTYGKSTAAAVLHYKRARTIINRSYQQTADDIVGKMTIASLDDGMLLLETGLLGMGGAALRLGSVLLASPLLAASKLVVITETAQPWSKWADQVVAADPRRRAKVPIPNGTGPAAVAAAFRRAIALAGAGGTVVISVGHGIPDSDSPDDGRFDLAPAGGFKVGGRNALLVGDPPPSNRQPNKPLIFHDTQVFYADSPPKPYQSRKTDDEANNTPAAHRRLANWQVYADISSAFASQRLALIVLLTCRISSATGLMHRVAQQWGNRVLGYTKRVVGQEVDGRARIFVEGDPPGGFYQWPNTTNTPAGETFFPISRYSNQIAPSADTP